MSLNQIISSAAQHQLNVPDIPACGISNVMQFAQLALSLSPLLLMVLHNGANQSVNKTQLLQVIFDYVDTIP